MSKNDILDNNGLKKDILWGRHNIVSVEEQTNEEYFPSSSPWRVKLKNLCYNLGLHWHLSQYNKKNSDHRVRLPELLKSRHVKKQSEFIRFISQVIFELGTIPTSLKCDKCGCLLNAFEREIKTIMEYSIIDFQKLVQNLDNCLAATAKG